MANNDLELKIEEQSKVKAMIEGINQSNMKNIESFEEQIQQRNVTINSLRSENDELKLGCPRSKLKIFKFLVDTLIQVQSLKIGTRSENGKRTI